MDPELKAAEWIGRRVRVEMDRPLGSFHPIHSRLRYELNYGFVPGTTGGDGHPIDVYVIDADTPLLECEGEVIAIIRRRDDIEDTLVVRLGGDDWSPAEIAARTHFQERYFDTYVDTGDAPSAG